MNRPNFDYEIQHGVQSAPPYRKAICGVDEVGRGPLAGPVVAAAVILPFELVSAGAFDHLNDSKRMTKKARTDASQLIQQEATWAIAEASVTEIDRLNVLWASMLAMKRAIENLSQKPDLALVDGNRVPDTDVECISLVKGDSKSLSIAAASIIAKVHRDAMMTELDLEFPAYGWAQNKGYPTKQHRDAIKQHGATPFHRMSFAPLKS